METGYQTCSVVIASAVANPRLPCSLSISLSSTLVVLVIIVYGIVLASPIAAGMVINTLTSYFRFTVAMAHMAKDRAANCSVAPGRPKPLMPSADITLIAFLFVIAAAELPRLGRG